MNDCEKAAYQKIIENVDVERILDTHEAETILHVITQHEGKLDRFNSLSASQRKILSKLRKSFFQDLFSGFKDEIMNALEDEDSTKLRSACLGLRSSWLQSEADSMMLESDALHGSSAITIKISSDVEKALSSYGQP